MLEAIGTGRVSTPSYGDRGVLTYRVDADDGSRLVKLADGADPFAVVAEVDRLDWIDGRLSTPRVLASAAVPTGGHVAVLTLPAGSAVDGPEHRVEPETTVDAIGRALAAVHALDADDCPFRMTLDLRLRSIRRRLNAGAYDPGLFTGAFRGRDPETLFALVDQRRPDGEDLVFTHGRFVPESLVAEPGGPPVVLDWAYGGMADRYVDLARVTGWVAERFGSELAARFVDSYGLERPDYDKLDYYAVLGQFA